jgi:large subunit ribosomal protein L33
MAKSKSSSKSKRKLFGLVSDDGKTRIYYTKKNTMNTPDKLTLRKYNPKTRQHEVFTETKKNLGRNEVKPKKH